MDDDSPRSTGLSDVDRAALRELVETYAYAVDHRDAALFASCYVDDGVNVVPNPPEYLGPVLERRGAAELTAALTALDRWPATVHAVVGQVVRATGPDQARGTVTCIAHHLSAGSPSWVDTIWYFRYQDSYQRENGVWRFTRRELTCDWIEERPVAAVRTEVKDLASGSHDLSSDRGF